MDTQVWWYLTRATGIVAWALGVASVLWGVALATRAMGNKPRAPWLLDLHRFLGGATVLFVGLHIVALVADSYVHFGVADVLVPMVSDWKPGALAWGIVAMWLLLAIELTSLAMRRLPKRLWRGVHLTAYAVAVLTTIHLLTAGTDATNPVLRVAAFAWVPVTVFFLLYRWLAPARRRAGAAARIPVRPPAAPGTPAPAPATAPDPAPAAEVLPTS